MPYTEFHYTPTGTGVISGKEVLEQTEDAINDLGGQISGDVQTAIDTANNALNTANTASADAQNAVNTANTAYTAATNAQNTANTAQNTASNALTAAQNAQNDVNALGNRVTTAENNITQNTSDISGLTTRMGTAEGNITTLQNDVITAQGTATSAQNTATLARGQAYVVRYASVAVSDNSTVPYTDLNNVDNIKANDLLLDINGKFYQITSVDTANETVSVTTPLTQLAVDSSVMHLSGNETKNGELTASKFISNYIQSETGNIQIQSIGTNRSCAIYNGASAGDGGGFWAYGKDSANGSDCRLQIYNTSKSRYERLDLVNSQWLPTPTKELDCGSASNKYKSFNGIAPGLMSFPDMSAGLDISGFISVTSGQNVLSTYTAPADGWISINLGRSSGSIGLIISNGSYSVSGRDNSYPDSHRECPAILPVFKNDTVTILSSLADSVLWAYFYPCMGNL